MVAGIALCPQGARRRTGEADRIEEVVVDAFADPPELTGTNPLGRLPALVLDDGTSLYDSPVITAYLDAVGNGDPLVPTDGAARFAVLRAEALADGVMDLGVGLVMERRKPDGETSPTMAARWRSQLHRALDAIGTDHARLPGSMSLGHIAFACALGYLDFRHPDISWREGREPLADWFAAISARPSLVDTAPR